MNLPETTVGSEIGAAVRSLRVAKTVFWLVLGLCIIAQIASWAVLRFSDIVPPPAAQADADQPAPGEPAEPDTEPAAEPAADNAAVPTDPDKLQGRIFLGWVLSVTKFVGLLAALLLSLTALMGSNMSIVTRSPGIAKLVSCFLWSLILVAIMVPWQDILDAPFVAGALFDLPDLEAGISAVRADWGASAQVPIDRIVMHYLRFAAYPLLALILWIIVQVKFGRGAAGMLPAPRFAGEPGYEG